MGNPEPIRCRLAACRESSGDGKHWSFYLINDGADPLESATLSDVIYSWGSEGSREAPETQVTALAPGAHALVWREDAGDELQTDFLMRVRARGREARLRFEFPKLYLKKNLPLVDGLGKPGWQEAAQG